MCSVTDHIKRYGWRFLCKKITVFAIKSNYAFFHGVLSADFAEKLKLLGVRATLHTGSRERGRLRLLV